MPGHSGDGSLTNSKHLQLLLFTNGCFVLVFNSQVVIKQIINICNKSRKVMFDLPYYS